MISNDSCTLYLQTAPSVYTRIAVPTCFWQNAKDGLIVSFDNSIQMPADYRGGSKEHSYIIRGVCALKVTDSSSLRTLLQTYDVHTITQINRLTYGSLPHYEVSAT